METSETGGKYQRTAENQTALITLWMTASLVSDVYVYENIRGHF